ncbi:MAG: MTH1187 family thiamine-binding protein [Desulfuromonadaceae bacterium]|nr:MTH1187 family thiamine-binding protein [Geobacteraceae bacterium]
MAVVQISCTPLGEGSGGISKFVAGCLTLVKESGLEYQLTPMGTIVEGDMDEIFALLRKMHESPFNAGAQRVSTLIKIDDRRDKEHTMQGKLNSVQTHLDSAQKG